MSERSFSQGPVPPRGGASGRLGGAGGEHLGRVRARGGARRRRRRVRRADDVRRGRGRRARRRRLPHDRRQGTGAVDDRRPAPRSADRRRAPGADAGGHLRALSGRVAVDIEIKNIPGEPDFEREGQLVVDATLATVARTGFSGPVLVSSFNPLAIAPCARSWLPEIPTGLLTDPRRGGAAPRSRTRATRGTLGAAVRRAGAGRGRRVRGRGARRRPSLGTWLTDDPAEAVELMRAGMDAVATNDPAAVVAARGVAFGP